MPVTEQDRRLAQRMADEVASIEKPGVRATAIIGARLVDAVVRAYQRRLDPIAVLRARMESMRAVVRDGMVTAHLTGIRRAQINRPRTLRLSTTAYRGAISFLRSRVAMSAASMRELSERYDADALVMLKGSSDATERALAQTLLKISEQGLHVRDGMAAIRETMKAQGLTVETYPKTVAPYRLEAIFRTQTQFAYAAGRHTSEADPFTQEFIWGYTYVTVGDVRVRPSHAAIDGTTLPKEHVFWVENMPPNGWNCRCQVITLFEERAIALPPEPFEFDGRTVTPGADPGFRVHPIEMAEVTARSTSETLIRSGQ